MRRLWPALPAILVVALIGLLLPPAFLGALDLNELKAVRTLKAIRSAQEQFKAKKFVDQNKNGKGEYGLLGELSGELVLRDSLSKKFKPSSSLLRGLETGGRGKGGTALRDGYYFCLYLPYLGGPNTDRVAGGDSETPGEALSASTDAEIIEAQEKSYCVYAWPEALNKTGRKVFFMNETGVISTIKERPRKKRSELRPGQENPIQTKLYEGANPIPANAAYETNAFTSNMALDKEGADGNLWVELK